MTPRLATPQQVLDTWFGPDPQAVNDHWFQADPAFDTLLHTRFQPTVQAALQGGLQDWESRLPGRQALVLVLDQFTRNLYRHQAAAFAGDARALALCRRMPAGLAVLTGRLCRPAATIARCSCTAPSTASFRWRRRTRWRSGCVNRPATR